MRTIPIARNLDAVVWSSQMVFSLLYVLLASFWLASSEITDRILQPGASVPLVSAFIAMGPGSGWYFAFIGDHLPRAAPFLCGVTAIPLVPFVVWSWSRNQAWLAVAATFWIATGYLCSAAIWV